jgi:hypothetical protein
MLRKTIFIRSLFFAAMLSVSAYANAKTDHSALSDDRSFPLLLTNPAQVQLLQRATDSIYNLVGLENYGLGKEAFFFACKGYQYLLNKGALKKKNLLTICDYSQSSNNKRLYVVDLATNTVLYNTYVSHGRNSGEEYATSFSNIENSNKSSLGFLVTDDTYHGVAGYSMRFVGMESGINDHVRSRSIVFHGSKFVNEAVMQRRGIIGRSLGCPAVPDGMQKDIIDAIKGGSCFYIYNPAAWYTHTSRILNAPLDYEKSIFVSGSNASKNTINSLAGNSSSLPYPEYSAK